MREQDDYQNICANIRFLRVKHGLSRTAMARRLHITVRTLDLLETDIWPERISVQLLFHIYSAFGIPPKVLLGTRLADGGK